MQSKYNCKIKELWQDSHIGSTMTFFQHTEVLLQVRVAEEEVHSPSQMQQVIYVATSALPWWPFTCTPLFKQIMS